MQRVPLGLLSLSLIYLFGVALKLCCCSQAFSRPEHSRSALHSCGQQGLFFLQCKGFSVRGRLLLQSVCSRHTGFSSYGTWAQLLWFTGLVTLQWHVGSSWTRNWTHVPCIGRWTLLHSTIREVLSHCILYHLPNTLSVRMVFLIVCSSLLFLISV